MFPPYAAYVVAICAMAFSALSASLLIYVVRHADPPDVRAAAKAREKTAV